MRAESSSQAPAAFFANLLPRAARPSTFFKEPWRTINWKDKHIDLQFVNEYKPLSDGQQLRILLYGPVGAGKSSFINSVQSVLRNRMYTQALAANTAQDCFTKKFTTYMIQKGDPETFYPFVFNDIMGLDSSKGVQVDDIKLVLKGHVKEDYKFNPESRMSEDDQSFIKSPTANDKVHVLVCVVPASTASLLNPKTVEKIRDIRNEASLLGIPQVAILTKIDESCPEIKKDLKNVYKLKYLKKKMEEFSAEVGIPMNCIFPVRNYHEEIDLDDETNSLILNTLRHIINFGDDHLNFHKSHSDC